MSDQRNFKEGLRGTTLFGGVGILNILISVAKSKIVAVLLGPAGMGVLGLFNSVVDLINKSTNFSLRTSAVKDISTAYASHDNNIISKTYSVFRKLIILTGLLGLFVCIVFSPYLSITSFGNYSHTIPFMILALSFPIFQLSDGLNVLMQGTRHLRLLAKSNVIGNVLALLAVAPFYFVFGIEGIVYTIVIGYLVHFAVTWYYANKIEIEKFPIRIKQAFIEGREMLKMGFMISLQGIFVALSAYIIRAFISNTANIEEVGLYTAGFYIINTYTGLVFSGMATEYYPRLASMANDNVGIFKAVDSQSELSILLLSPLLSAFILFGNVAIILLYSKDFLGITMMINISMLGMFFKAPSWCLGYVYLGKGDSKAFFWNELLTICYSLALNILFYQLWGLTGMGVSFLLSFIIYWIQNVLVCYFRYGYKFNTNIIKILVPQLSLAILCFGCVFIENLWIKYIIGGSLLLLSIYFSYRVLRNNIDLSHIKTKINNRL